MIRFKHAATVALVVFGIGFTGISHAALFDRGGGMIYDSDQNITWLADANLFKTQAASDTNLVNEIITANGGHINYTPNANDGGVHRLTIYDFDTNWGGMTWFGAQAWANSLVVGSFSDWHLPTTSPDISRFNQTGSELGYLFYGELGGTVSRSIVTSHNANYDLFSNVKEVYWSGTEFSSIPGYAWYFDASVGYHELNFGGYQLYAWAVRTGDVAAVPVPGAIWLFASGLSLLAFNLRQKSKYSQLQYC